MRFYNDATAQWETTEYAYSPRNELTSLYDDDAGTTWVFEYDLRGNLTKKVDASDAADWVTYAWDSSDLLTGVVDNVASRTVDYRYDAFGRRVAKKVDGGDWRWFHYDGLNVLAEGTGTADKAFNTLVGGGPGGIVARDLNGTKYWYHFDRLGNVMAVTDASGNAADLYTMDAFGNVQQIGDGDYATESPTAVQPYFLTTKEYDPDAGLYYFNARWYDSTTGRWISREPTGIDGPNLYSFCLNDPANWFDPDGLYRRTGFDRFMDGLMNFSCGFGDAISFGLTKGVRRLFSIDPIGVGCTAFYKVGKISWAVFETIGTGGSAVLRGLAKGAVRSKVYGEARKYTAKIARNKKILHHLNPLFGHPGAARGRHAVFPTGGLPAWIHSGPWNRRLVTHVKHMQLHRRLRKAESVWRVLYNPYMTAAAWTQVATDSCLLDACLE